MILNDRQYELAMANRRKLVLEQTLVGRLRIPLEASDLIRYETQRIGAMIEAVNTDIQEYESLKFGNLAAPSLHGVASLPEDLIRARIALGWIQKELARVSSLSEQTIQRYEATRYASVKLSRVMEIAEILDSALRLREESMRRLTCSRHAQQSD